MAVDAGVDSRAGNRMTGSTRTGARAAGLLAVALVMLAACSSTKSTGTTTGTGRTASTSSATTGRAKALPTGTYVALGSSFAAGPGIPPVDDQYCARSTDDYPHQVAAALHLTLVDVTCSAATTADFTQPQGPKPPQLDAITADTGLVTINMGGNDIGFSGSSLSCSSKAAAQQPCQLPTPDVTDQKAAAMTAALVSAIHQVQQKAPKAQIYVVSYLDVYPDPGRSCPPDNLISDADSATIQHMGVVLNDATRAAAVQAHVPFVDAYAASKGHDICSGKDQRDVEGAKVENTGYNYHPNPAGMTEYTKVVLAAIRGGSS
jgi:lysophospholipase L1-like esterase